MSGALKRRNIKAIQMKTPFVKIASDIPTSSILWCYITVSVGWPQDQN